MEYRTRQDDFWKYLDTKLEEVRQDIRACPQPILDSMFAGTQFDPKGPQQMARPDVNKMTRGEALAFAKQVAGFLAEAEALIKKYGEDHKDGTVIAFSKQFGADQRAVQEHLNTITGNPVGLSVYHYAGLRAGGRWYLTGPTSGAGGIEWEELLDFLDTGIPCEEVDVLREGKAPKALNGGTQARVVVKEDDDEDDDDDDESDSQMAYGARVDE
jgi:hypothetical protein